MKKAATLIFLFCISCINMPEKEQTKLLMTMPNGKESIKNSLNNPLFCLGEWPEDLWWEIFNTPELNKYIDEAVSLNPDLKSVEQKINYAKQEAIIKRSKLYPLVFFDASDNYSYLSKTGIYYSLNPKIPRVGNLIDLSLSFNYELDFWSKYRNTFYAALGREQAQVAEYKDAKLILTTALAQVFFALKTNLQRKLILSRIVSLKSDLVNLNNLLHYESLSSNLPLWLSEENLDETKKELIFVEEEIEKNKHFINALRGKGPDEIIEINQELDSLPKKFQIPCDLFLDLLARRPDLMAAIWRAKAIAHEVGAAVADFFPNISLTGQEGFQSLLINKLFNPISSTGSLIPALHLPVFTAGAISSNVKAKKALFEEAIYSYNNLILKSAEEVTNALVIVNSAWERQERQQDILDKAFKRFELTKLLKVNCLDTSLNQYSFEIEYLTKKLGKLELEYQQYASLIKLIKSLGGGFNAKDSIPLKKEDNN
jgi:NodT family efflux transporter outer membrane factor (OMF) lipoprotein